MKLNKVKRGITKGLRTLKKHSPTILTGLSVLGVIGTAIVSANNMKSTLDILREDEAMMGELPKSYVIRVGLKKFIPTFLVGGGTIASTIMSNQMSKKQIAGLTGAYLLTAQKLDEYKKTVTELYGDNAIENVEKKIVAHKIEKSPMPLPTPDEDSDKVLFYDEYLECFFEATWEEMAHVMTAINDHFDECGEVRYKYYLSLLGFTDYQMDDIPNDLGWDICMGQQYYNYSSVQFSFYKEECGVDDIPIYTIVSFPCSPHLIGVAPKDDPTMNWLDAAYLNP